MHTQARQARQHSSALALFTLSPMTKSCEKAGGEFTRMLPAMNNISQVKPKEQSWLAAHWSPGLVSLFWKSSLEPEVVHNSSQEFQSKPHQHPIKSLISSQFISVLPECNDRAGIILNSRTLFWSLPNLHSRFLIQLDEHWVFMPTVPHGIDACVQNRLLCQTHLHSVSPMYQLHDHNLNLRAKRKRKTSSITMSPSQEPNSALFTMSFVLRQ